MQAFVILVAKMYSPPPTNKQQTIKQVAIYVLMTASVLILVTLLVLNMLGYRFNQADGTIEQGGLVQLSSLPIGAGVQIDAAKLSATTSTKATLSAGEHAITMSREGYISWQKTVDVKRGTILWLNYARLIPVERPVESIETLPAITSSLPSPNRKFYALTTTRSSPMIRLVGIDSDSPDIKTITIPETAYTTSATPENDIFQLGSWDPSSRYLLVEHFYDDKSEWIMVDSEDSARTKNISAIFDITLTKPQFSQSDSNSIYALTNGDIRKIDVDASTISAPLVRNVTEFSFFDRTTLLYVTAIDQTTKTRSVGYRQDTATKPRAIRSYSDDGTIPLHIAMGKYYNQPYVGIAYGTSLDILSGSLPRSDSETSLALTNISTMSIAEPITFLSNRTDGRFFVAQHGNSYSVYDLELQKATTTTLKGATAPAGELQWLDGYTVWGTADSMLRFYEFDGANQNDIMPIIAGQVPALTPNNRYLYAPTTDATGAVHLSRIRLILQ